MDDYVAGPKSNKSTEGLRKLWTPERMKAAEALSRDIADASLGEAPPPTEQASSVAGQKPTELKESDPLVPTEGETYLITDTTVFPYSAIGKLYYNIAGGLPQVASASVTAPGGLTLAAHLVYSMIPPQHGWSSDYFFVPAYNLGDAPFGGFGIDIPYVMPQWIAKENDAYDFALATTLENVGHLTGYLGYVVNLQTQGRQWVGVGYPTGRGNPNFPFNGEQMWANLGAFTGYAGGQVYKENSLTLGASGGPWLLSGANGTQVNGVASRGDNQVATSVYFTNWVQQFHLDIFGF